MITFLLWAACDDSVHDLLERAERSRGSWTARVTVVSGGRYDESSESSTGRVTVRVSKSGERTLRVEGANPSAFDLLRRGLSRKLLEDFEARLERGPRALPPAVTGADGMPVAPVAVKPPGAKKSVAVVAPDRRCVLSLVPKDRARRVSLIRLYVDRESLRIEGVVVETPTHVTTCVLSGHEDLAEERK